MGDLQRPATELEELLSEMAELRIEVEPEGRSVFRAMLPGKNAKDLLPLTGMLLCAVGPGITFWSVGVAGMPYWVPLLVVLIQVCGIIVILMHRRT